MKSVNPIYDRMGTTIFQAMNDLARQHDAINLGRASRTTTALRTCARPPRMR